MGLDPDLHRDRMLDLDPNKKNVFPIAILCLPLPHLEGSAPVVYLLVYLMCISPWTR